MNCKDCIKQDVCFIRINNDNKDCYRDENGTVCSRFIEDKHGEWTLSVNPRCYERSIFKCSKCGAEITNDWVVDGFMGRAMRFCMHCGARMDGGKK